MTVKLVVLTPNSDFLIASPKVWVTNWVSTLWTVTVLMVTSVVSGYGGIVLANCGVMLNGCCGG